MTSRKPRKEGIEEVKDSEVETDTPELLSFETYIARAKPRAGLVTSFTYEAKKSQKGLKDRSEADWKADFEAQANKIYLSFQ